MASIASWIYDRPLRGNYTFTHDEVVQAFPDMSAGSIARALTREVSKGLVNNDTKTKDDSQVAALSKLNE